MGCVGNELPTLQGLRLRVNAVWDARDVAQSQETREMLGGLINQKIMQKGTWAAMRKKSHCQRQNFSARQALFATISNYFQCVPYEALNLGRLVTDPIDLQQPYFILLTFDIRSAL